MMMPMNAEYYRLRAEELRVVADTIKQPEMRRILNICADGYDDIANKIDQQMMAAVSATPTPSGLSAA
jgi:hypothetical protein